MVKLDDEIWFPDPKSCNNPEGLLAFGGDLSPERLIFGYESGIFPWYNPGEEILWWSPDPRFVLFPKEAKVSKSMKKILRDGVFTFSENKFFPEVMTRCMQTKRRGQDGTWISKEMVESYTELHRRGIAKSFEVYHKNELVGGFYGLQIGRVFCGESMFAKVSNASKAGFLNFVINNKENLDIIDCQVYTEHLESLGAREIPRSDFLEILSAQKIP